jgi:hypothetical protein
MSTASFHGLEEKSSLAVSLLTTTFSHGRLSLYPVEDDARNHTIGSFVFQCDHGSEFFVCCTVDLRTQIIIYSVNRIKKGVSHHSRHRGELMIIT